MKFIELMNTFIYIRHPWHVDIGSTYTRHS